MEMRSDHEDPSRAFPVTSSRRHALKLVGATFVGAILSGCTSASRRVPTGTEGATGSWNPFVRCGHPIVATIEQVIGTNQSDCSPPGAALPDWADMSRYQSAPFWNGPVPGDFRTNYGTIRDSGKNCLDCPCVGVHGRPIFVQINGVVLTDPELADDGDTTFNIHTPAMNGNVFMHQIHCEISQSWKAANRLPSSAMSTSDPSEMLRHLGELIDVQGLVFADLSKAVNEGVCSGHSNSVWELHPLTAWRLHR
jgi:hypothetical protein